MQNNYQSLTAFAQEIERRDQTRQDYVAASEKIRMVSDNNIGLDGVSGLFGINEYAHGQISNKLGIPKKYYDQMSIIPGLRTANVNAWLSNEPAEKRMVRTLDGSVRAVLSDSYRTLDHYALMAGAIFPAVEPFKDNVMVKASSLSDTKLYMQLVFKNLAAEIKKGDVVQYGLTITNSEVGAGAFKVESLIWRLVCSNGMLGTNLFRKYHVGRQDYSEDENRMIYASDTVKKQLETYQLQLRDVIKHALTDEEFMKTVKALKEAREDKIENVTRTVENVTKRFSFSEKDGEKMMTNLIQEGEINRYGLANSVTALAHSIENPDNQYKVEGIGAQIIELSSKDWKVLTDEKVA